MDSTTFLPAMRTAADVQNLCPSCTPDGTAREAAADQFARHGFCWVPCPKCGKNIIVPRTPNPAGPFYPAACMEDEAA